MTVNTSWCLSEWVRVCKEYSSAEHHWSRGIESQQPEPSRAGWGGWGKGASAGRRLLPLAPLRFLAAGC